MRESMMMLCVTIKQKEGFVFVLAEMLRNYISDQNIIDLRYEKDTREWVIVFFLDGDKKRFEVTGDDFLHILFSLVDFLKDKDSDRYIIPEVVE